MYNPSLQTSSFIILFSSFFFFAGNADPSLYYNEYYEASNGGHSAAQYTWLIALLGSLAFMLILVSFVMIYYRKKPKHYLAANTSGKDSKRGRKIG